MSTAVVAEVEGKIKEMGFASQAKERLNGAIPLEGEFLISDGKRVQGNGSWLMLQSKPPFHITRVSQLWSDLWGYKAEEAIGRSFKLLQGPGSDQVEISRMLENVQNGQPSSLMVITYHKEGRPLVSWLDVQPLFDQDNQVSRILAKSSCTETVFMKEALEDVGSWAIVTTDRKLTITKTSGKLCELTGFPESSLASRPFRVLLGPASVEAVIADEVSACLLGKGSVGNALITVYTYEARPVVCLIKAQAILDPKKMAVSHLKILLQKADLLTLEEGMRNTHEAKFIALSKPPHPIAYVSPEWSAYYEFSSSEAVSNTIEIFQGQCTDAIMLNEVLGRSILSSLPQEARLITYSKSGAPLVTSIRLSPLISKSGYIQHFLAQVTIIDNNEEDLRHDKIETDSAEYPSTPEGRITHLNGCTHLVLFPREDPTLTHCISYMRHLRDAGVVRTWDWHKDALHVHVDTNRVLEYTHSSRWCQQWTPDLRTWHAWWNRMLWVVSKASMKHGSDSKLKIEFEESDAGSDLSFLADLVPEDEIIQISGDIPFPDGRLASESLEYSTTWAKYTWQEHTAAYYHAGPPASNTISQNRDEKLYVIEEDDGPGTSNEKRQKFCAVSEESKLYYQKSFWQVLFDDIAKELNSVSLDFPVCVLDNEGRIVFLNDAFADQASVEPLDVLGCKWHVLLHHTCGEDCRQAWKDNLHSRTPLATHMTSQYADGSAFSAYARVNPCVALGVLCFCVSIVECGDLVRSDDLQQQPVAEEEDDEFSSRHDDVFREHEMEELHLLQQHAMFKLEHVLQRLSRLYKEASPSSNSNSSKPPSVYTEIVILMDLSDVVLRQCGSMLWRLGELGVVNRWWWDTDSLNVSVHMEALRSHAVQSSWCQLWASGGGCAGMQHLVQMVALLDAHAGGKLQRERHEHLALADARHATDFRFLVGGPHAAPRDDGRRARHPCGDICSGNDFSDIAKGPARRRHYSGTAEVAPTTLKAPTATVSSLSDVLAPAAAAAAVDVGNEERPSAEKEGRSDLAAVMAALEGLRLRCVRGEERQSELAARLCGLEDEVTQLQFHQDVLIQQMVFEDDKAHETSAHATAASAAPAAAAARAHQARPVEKEHVEPHVWEEEDPPAVVVQEFGRLVVEANPDAGLSLLDETGAILWANGPFLGTTGFRLEEVVGCRWTSFLCGPATEVEDLARLDAARVARAEESLCLQCYRENGRPLWLQVKQWPFSLDAAVSSGNVPVGPAAVAATATTAAASRQCLFLLSAVDATELLEQVVRMGRPMDEHRDPELFRASQRISTSLAGAFAVGERALAEVLGSAYKSSESRICGATMGSASRDSAVPPPPLAGAGGSDGGDPARCDADEEPEASAAAVVSALEPWIILEVSAEWEGLFGFPEHEARGRSLGIILGAQGWSVFAAAAAALAASPRGADASAAVSRATLTARTRSGTPVELNLEIFPAATAVAAKSGPPTQLRAVFRPAIAAGVGVAGGVGGRRSS